MEKEIKKYSPETRKYLILKEKDYLFNAEFNFHNEEDNLTLIQEDIDETDILVLSRKDAIKLNNLIIKELSLSLDDLNFLYEEKLEESKCQKK